MVTRKLSSSEKIFLFLITNTVVFGGVFSLKFIGLAIDSILLIFITVASFEMAYFIIFIQRSVSKNSQNLEKTEKQIEDIRDNLEKNNNLLIYLGHQMKTIQHDINTLRRSNIFKPGGNNHLKIHA